MANLYGKVMARAKQERKDADRTCSGCECPRGFTCTTEIDRAEVKRHTHVSIIDSTKCESGVAYRVVFQPPLGKEWEFSSECRCVPIEWV